MTKPYIMKINRMKQIKVVTIDYQIIISLYIKLGSTLSDRCLNPYVYDEDNLGSQKITNSFFPFRSATLSPCKLYNNPVELYVVMHKY